jgi:transcriptional regulator with XRE-family HTH domain
MDLATTLRQARLQAGLSQSQLGPLLVTARCPDGMWSTYVGQIENGTKVPSEEACLKLAEILQLEPLGLLVAACRARADAAPAQAFLDELAGALALDGFAASAGPQRRAAASDGVSSRSAPDAGLDDDPWRDLVRRLGRMGRLPELPRLLADLAAIEAARWEQLRRLLRHPVLRERPGAGA